MKTKIFNLLIVAIFAAFFSGCISVTKELPPKKSYKLDYLSVLNKFENKKVSLRVYEPKAINSLNSQNMIYENSDFKKASYALNKWSDKPTKMLQEKITSYLNKTNLFNYVTTSKLNSKSDYKLITEVASFSHLFEKEVSYAKLELRIFLVDNRTKKTFFKEFSYKNRVPKKGVDAYVKEKNRVLDSFLKELSIFLNNSIQ